MILMKVLFWVSSGWVFYTYLGYPVLLLLLASLWQVRTDLKFSLARSNRRGRTQSGPPSVSFLLSAYNEEAVIAQKMENCAQIEYPRDRLEILVGCDGCSDNTAAIARAANAPNARVIEFSQRGGKPAVLNQLAAACTGQILVFTDANTMLQPDALMALTRQFSSPDVGCVCGELRLRSASGAAAEGIYWRYEVFLKFLESRLNMLLGANGALFAIRRELFEPVPQFGVIDDFLIAMKVHERGYRIVYNPEAIGEEEFAPSVRHEFRRRVRIGAGNFYALRYTAKLLRPSAGMVALSYWSHKVFRWLSPVAMAVALISAATLAGEPFFAVCAISGILFGLLGCIGHYLELRKGNNALFSIPYYFLSMNLALFFGLTKCLRGRQSIVWSPTREQTVAAEEDQKPAVEEAEA
jgi:cellulose synthase/poly-beta-1,6-N-acetylglucosamine synthase-like glycosyltransferase